MINVATDAIGVSFPVRLQPRAKKCAVTGVFNGALKAAVTAAPEAGKANKALVALLAKCFGVPKSAVEVVAGHTSRDKRVRIASSSPQQLAERIQGFGGSQS